MNKANIKILLKKKTHNLPPSRGKKLNETKFVNNNPLIILANTTVISAPE